MLPDSNNVTLSPTGKLASNVRALTRATMAAMEAGQNDNEETESDSEDEESADWSKIILAVIDQDNWVGSNIKTTIGANCNIILEAFSRELGQFVVDEELLESSPRISLDVAALSGGLTLEDAWRKDKIKFKFLVNGRSLSEMPIYLDPKEEETNLEVWVYKKKPKEDKLLGVASTTDKAVIGKNVVDVPVMLGSSEVGTLKLSIESHNTDEKESVIDKLITRTIDLLKKTVAGKLSKVLSQDKSDISKITYEVHIEKNGTPDSGSPKSYLLHDHKKYEEQITIIPLSSLAKSSLVFVTEANGDSTTSKSLANTPMKKKEKRRSLDALLAETLHWNSGAQEPDNPAQHKEEVSAEGLHWFKPLEIRQGNTSWTVTLRGKLESDLDIVWQSHFEKIYLAHLSLLNDQKRLNWHGELSPDLEILSNSILSIIPEDIYEKRAEMKRRALIKLHHKIPFNAGLMYSSLAALSNNRIDLSTISGAGDYLSYCIRQIIGMTFRSKKIKINQAPLMAKSLDLICSDKVEELVSGVRGLLRSRLLVLLDGEQLVRYCREHLLAMARSLKTTNESEWSKQLMQLMIDETCEELKLRTGDLAEVDGVQLVYFCFLNVREACRQMDMDEEQVHRAFEPALLSLIDLVATKAKEQVEKVLELERSNHGCDRAYWESKEWEDASSDVDGIFDSCIFTFQELDWPDAAKYVEFGIHLFNSIHQVFKQYVQDYLDIVTSDDDFDKQELVMIILSVVKSTNYLHKASKAIHKVVELKKNNSSSSNNNNNNNDVREKLRAFSEVLSTATVEADDVVEDVLAAFCDSQKRGQIRKLVKDGKIAGEEDEDVVLVAYIHSLLDFLYDHLEERKHFDLLAGGLMEAAETEMESEFEERKKFYAKRRDPEVFQTLAEGIQPMVDFRKSLNLNPSQVLIKMQEELHPRGAETCTLISEHLLSIIKGRNESEIVGKLSWRCAFVGSKDSLLVQLVSVSDVLPRTHEKEASFSLTVSVLPLAKEPYIDRRRTRSYFKTRSVNFSEETSSDRVMTFLLPSRSYCTSGCLIEVALYHQIAYSMKKVFAGSAYRSLNQIETIESDEDLQQVKLTSEILTKIEHIDTPEYAELSKRKDYLARMFLDRYDRQRLGKSFYEIQEWAKLDEQQETDRIIYRHLEELHLDHVERSKEAGEKVLARLEARLAFNESTEELTVNLLRLLSPQMQPRSGSESFNPGLEVSLLPLHHVPPKRTKVRPSPPPEAHLDFSIDSSAYMTFNLRKVNYNYHRTYLHIVLYDYERPSSASQLLLHNKARSERFFRAHALIALSDIHPLMTSLDLRRNQAVASRKIKLTSISIKDSEALIELLKRKDKRSKDYVTGLNQMRDCVAQKVRYSKYDWADDRGLTPTIKLICRDLEWSRMMQFDRAGRESSLAETMPKLRYRVWLDEKSHRLNVTLRSVTGVPECEGFSINMLALPSSVPPYWLKRRSATLRGQDVFFDFIDPDLKDLEEPPETVFVIDLPRSNLDLKYSYLSFELVLNHHWKFSRAGDVFGVFFVMMDAVARDEDEGDVDLEGLFLPLGEDVSAEFAELEERSSDAMAKAYVKKYSKARNIDRMSRFFAF